MQTTPVAEQDSAQCGRLGEQCAFFTSAAWGSVGATTEPARNARIEISLFGGFQARVGGRPLSFPTRKSQALVAYLSSIPGKLHDREAIHALLWPDSAKAQAQASLRQALLAVRKALSIGAPDALRSSDTTISIDASQVCVDISALERCAADPTPEALARIPSVCTGPFLDGFSIGELPFDDWVSFERSRFLELAVGALEKLAEYQAAAGRLDRAIQTALHSLKLEPFQERTHRMLMRLYASHGRRAEAMQQYETCAAMLRRELGVEPDPHTQQLHRDLLRNVASSRLAPFAAVGPSSQPPVVGRRNERRADSTGRATAAPSEERREQMHHTTDPYQPAATMALLIAKYQAADKPERLNIIRAALDVAAPLVERLMELFPPISPLEMRIEYQMIATRLGVLVTIHRGETASELHCALEDVIEDCREAQRRAR